LKLSQWQDFGEADGGQMIESQNAWEPNFLQPVEFALISNLRKKKWRKFNAINRAKPLRLSSLHL